MLLAQMMRYGTEGAQKNIDDRYFDHHPMMQWMGGTTGLWLDGIFSLVTWILVITLLIALIRWLWKKGDNESKARR